jgi:hypothetical protein
MRIRAVFIAIAPKSPGIWECYLDLAEEAREEALSDEQ